MVFKRTETRPSLPWLIAPFFLWGSAMVAMKGAIAHTSPLFLASVRLIPAGILILIAAAYLGKSQPKNLVGWLWIALFGLVDGALFQGFLAEGLARTGAGLGSVMIDSQPLAVALMARFLFGERIGVWGWLGLGFGVVGISLLGLPQEWLASWFQDGQTLAAESLDLMTQIFQGGQWLMLLAAMAMAVGTVMVRYVSRHVDPVVATGWHMIFGGLPLLGLSAVFEVNQWGNLNFSDWMALSYSTVFGSAIAYALFFSFASSGNLTSLSSLTFLTPVFALLFGNWFLNEWLEPVQWVGVALTLVSIYLINQRDRLADQWRLWSRAEAAETDEAIAIEVEDASSN